MLVITWLCTGVHTGSGGDALGAAWSGSVVCADVAAVFEIVHHLSSCMVFTLVLCWSQTMRCHFVAHIVCYRARFACNHHSNSVPVVYGMQGAQEDADEVTNIMRQPAGRITTQQKFYHLARHQPLTATAASAAGAAPAPHRGDVHRHHLQPRAVCCCGALHGCGGCCHK